MHLADTSARTASRSRIASLDFVFLSAVTLALLGGCFLLLDLAAARSSAQESTAWHLLSQVLTFVPAMAAMIGKYSLLFLACVANSALIVLIVQGLRTVDKKITRPLPMLKLSGSHQSNATHFKMVRQQPKSLNYRHDARPFLLSPVFR